MKQIKFKRAIAISGVIGGMVLLKPMTAHATENGQAVSTEPQVENINSRISSKGQVVNVDGTYLRIRANASTNSEVLGTMSEGIKFDIISKSNEWYKIQYNGIVGYVHGDYVAEINSTSNESILYYGKVYNADPNLRVRSGASLNSSIIGYVVDNTTVSIVGVEGSWYKIKYNNGYGYVHSDYVLVSSITGESDSNNNNENNSGQTTINKVGYAYNLDHSALRIRKGPSTSSDILGNIYEGDSVNIIGEEGSWYKISYNNSVAYISKDYITFTTSSDSDTSVTAPSNPGNVVIATGRVINVEGSNLRVRQKSSTDSFVIGYLLNNSQVDILAKEGNWYKIIFRDDIGYVSADYISISGDSVSSGGSVSQKEKFNTIFNAMKSHIGSPYVWGGAGEELTTSFLNELKRRFPGETAEGEYIYAERYVDQGYYAFDCSGLMQWGFAQAGISIGRTTYNQIYDGVEVSLNDVVPGDLIFTTDLGHVGMYIGNNQWIESSFTGDTVRISNVPWGYVGRARRIL